MKKKNMSEKAVKLMSVILAAGLLMTACGRSNKDNGNNQSQPQTETEQSSSTEEQSQTGAGDGTMEDFQGLLGGENNDEDIYGFFDNNISSFSHDDVDTMMTGFFGRFDDIGQVDFNRLSAHRDAMSPEMQDFVELMMTEQGSPAISDEEGIQLTLPDLLNRCKIYEDFLQKYPEGNTYQYAYDYYERMLTQAISGGYDGENADSHYYRDTENSGELDKLALDAYRTFIEANPDSITGRVVSDYVTQLSENKNKIDGTLNTYYQGLGEKIKGHFNS